VTDQPIDIGYLSLPAEVQRDIEAGAAEAAKRRKSEKRRRTVLVCVRLTPAELEAVHAAAAGAPLSGWLRDLAVGAAERADAPAAASGDSGTAPPAPSRTRALAESWLTDGTFAEAIHGRAILDALIADGQDETRLRARAEAAEAKLAVIERACRESGIRPAAGVAQMGTVRASDILAIISGEEEGRSDA